MNDDDLIASLKDLLSGGSAAQEEAEAGTLAPEPEADDAFLEKLRACEDKVNER